MTQNLPKFARNKKLTKRPKRQRMELKMRKAETQIQQRKRKREVSLTNLMFLIDLSYIDKKKAAAPTAELGVREQDNSYLRNLGNWAPGPWK
jgi:hypothetical protein